MFKNVQKCSKLKMVNQYYHQNVLYVVVKEQEAKRFLSNIGLKKPLSKIPILGDVLF